MLKISRKLGKCHPNGITYEDIDVLKYITKTCRRYKKGLVVAHVNYEKRKVYVGWSLCNTTAGDKFCKIRGLEIAVGRMENHKLKLDDDGIGDFLHKYVPESLHDTMLTVFERCKRMLNSKKNKRKKDEN